MSKSGCYPRRHLCVPDPVFFHVVRRASECRMSRSDVVQRALEWQIKNGWPCLVKQADGFPNLRLVGQEART